MMIPDAFAFQRDYERLKMPVVILAGEGDRIVDVERTKPQLRSRSERRAPSSQARV
jgi:alpha-beta hydrolase superfamily lysophospholipase